MYDYVCTLVSRRTAYTASFREEKERTAHQMCDRQARTPHTPSGNSHGVIWRDAKVSAYRVLCSETLAWSSQLAGVEAPFRNARCVRVHVAAQHGESTSHGHPDSVCVDRSGRRTGTHGHNHKFFFFRCINHRSSRMSQTLLFDCIDYEKYLPEKMSFHEV